MGYRSNVKLALKKQVYYDNQASILESIKDCDSISETEEAYFFLWESVKWYESYEDVKAITKLMSSLKSEDFGFMRIGEDKDDIEEAGEPYEYDIYLVRQFFNENEDEEELDKEEFFKPNSIKFIKEE